jgi:hypothetical protein
MRIQLIKTNERRFDKKKPRKMQTENVCQSKRGSQAEKRELPLLI